jgi:hypothetical protein
VTLAELALGAAGSVDRLDGGQALATTTAGGTHLQLDPPAGPDVPAVIRLTEARSVRA